MQDINQRYGYRNVVVTVLVEGQVADGYRLTNTTVFPPLVTVFSSDPAIVNELPGYVNTVPLNLTGLKDDVDISLPLNLPEGVSVVDDRTSVLVRLSVAAVQSSMPVGECAGGSDWVIPVIGCQVGTGNRNDHSFRSAAVVRFRLIVKISE